ncbi:MAG: hypothetical protein WC641_02010 [Patescibacteria group bacterium]
MKKKIVNVLVDNVSGFFAAFWVAYIWSLFDSQVRRFDLVIYAALLIFVADGVAVFRARHQAKKELVVWQDSYVNCLLACIGWLQAYRVGPAAIVAGLTQRDKLFRQLIQALNDGARLDETQVPVEALKELVDRATKEGKLDYGNKAHRRLMDLV